MLPLTHFFPIQSPRSGSASGPLESAIPSGVGASDRTCCPSEYEDFDPADVDDDPRERLFDAVYSDDGIEYIKEFMDAGGAHALHHTLSGDPFSALHYACVTYNPDALRLMLSYPGVNADLVPDGRGWTPLLDAACGHSFECQELLLRRPEVDVNAAFFGDTPLIMACRSDGLEFVRLMIALRGDELDVNKRVTDNNDYGDCDAVTVCRKTGDLEIFDLLIKFQEKPRETIAELRFRLRFFREDVAELFAMTVFLCDGHYSMKSESRFFALIYRLPMELQMMACNRVFGSLADSVLQRHSEPAFKRIAAIS